MAVELNVTAVPLDAAGPSRWTLAAAAPDAQLTWLDTSIVGSARDAPSEVDPQEWQAVVTMNLDAVINGLRAFVPRLLASGRRGPIEITASSVGLANLPGR